jgi:AraC family transcriptional regulator
MSRPHLDLRLRDDRSAVQSRIVTRAPYRLEYVTTPKGAAYDFSWGGETAYLAWHDIVLRDGEIQVDGLAPNKTRDLRDRLTFIPQGAKSLGWCAQQDRQNSFLALYFDQHWLAEQLELSSSQAQLIPKLYFQDRDLLITMEKLAHTMSGSDQAPRILIDTLVLLAGAELVRTSPPQSLKAHTARGLTQLQVTKAIDYIEAHAIDNVSLAEIASAVGLSQFHFCRAFKHATGRSPHQYALLLRVDRAKQLLKNHSTSVADIASAVGFKSISHFSRTFSQIAGQSPSDYRNAHGQTTSGASRSQNHAHLRTDA